MRTTDKSKITSTNLYAARKQAEKNHPWSEMCQIIADAYAEALSFYRASNVPSQGEEIRVEVSGGTNETTWCIDVPDWLLGDFMIHLISFDSGEINQILIGSSSDDEGLHGRPGVSIFEKRKQREQIQKADIAEAKVTIYNVGNEFEKISKELKETQKEFNKLKDMKHTKFKI